MPYKQDSNVVSLFWGRIGAAVLLLISVALQGFGYTFGPEDQAMVYDAVQSVLNAGALIFIVASKVRESKKVEEAKLDLMKKDAGL